MEIQPGAEGQTEAGVKQATLPSTPMARNSASHTSMSEHSTSIDTGYSPDPTLKQTRRDSQEHTNHPNQLVPDGSSAETQASNEDIPDIKVGNGSLSAPDIFKAWVQGDSSVAARSSSHHSSDSASLRNVGERFLQVAEDEQHALHSTLPVSTEDLSQQRPSTMSSVRVGDDSGPARSVDDMPRAELSHAALSHAERLSKIVVLKVPQHSARDRTQTTDRLSESYIIPTPPASHASSVEGYMTPSLHISRKAEHIVNAYLPPGMYGRDPNPRRGATKEYRGPITPEKTEPREATGVVAALRHATVKTSNKRSLSESAQPGLKRRKLSCVSSNTTPSIHSQTAKDTAQNVSSSSTVHQLPTPQGEVLLRPFRDVDHDRGFVEALQKVLETRYLAKRKDMGWRQAYRISRLLELARYPDETEALFLSAEEASKYLEPGRFWNNIVVTEGQQALPLQTVEQFLDEFYEDDAYVWIQDPKVIPNKTTPITRQVRMRLVKDRLLSGKKTDKPWNLLELATHCDDGLRPAFLNTEDSRLLTKLKIPDASDHARRRVYEQGYKEVEKWALLAQAGALTEPHQDSHGYSTYITINTGLVGFGWLSFPTTEERAAWRQSPSTFEGGQWRYIVLKPGQTVYFPGGTVHFVFRSPEHGHTLAFGGHILRCSNIVHWVKTMLEERDSKDITNEDLTDSATGYLERVERFVHHARATGTAAKWGGEEAIEEFLELKRQFLRKKQAKS